MRTSSLQLERHDASVDAPGLGVGATERPGEAVFADEMNRLIEQLGPTNLRLSVHQVQLYFLPPSLAFELVRKAAGLSGAVTRLAPCTFAVVFIGAGPSLSWDRGFGGRVSTLMSEFTDRDSEPHGAAPLAQLRTHQVWSHDIVDPIYLLQQVSDESATLIHPAFAAA